VLTGNGCELRHSKQTPATGVSGRNCELSQVTTVALTGVAWTFSDCRMYDASRWFSAYIALGACCCCCATWPGLEGSDCDRISCSLSMCAVSSERGIQ
jgi:hypothetical protein